jgi:hypothetical protein
MEWQGVIAIATIFLVVATMILVYVTARYNRKILAEALAMRQAEFKPIIYVSDWSDSNNPGPNNQWFQFYLKNIGRGPAFDIEVRIDGIKPETVDPGKNLPTCLASGEKTPTNRIVYGDEKIAASIFDAPNLSVTYRDMSGHKMKSSLRLIQHELRITPADPPFYFVKPTAEFVVKDL